MVEVRDVEKRLVLEALRLHSPAIDFSDLDNRSIRSLWQLSGQRIHPSIDQ